MLSTTSISAIDKRRKAHRRQKSTPITEMPHLAPATTGLQRAAKARGHRRGLSLDDRSTTYQPTTNRMTPTLGPISQEDVKVSTPNPGQTPQQMQFAQPQELVQPGQPEQFNPMHPQFQIQSFFAHATRHEQAIPLSPFSQPTPETQLLNSFSPSPQLLQSSTFHSPNPQSVDQTQAHLQQFESAKRQLEAHLGAQINIQVLPTPVATPQKRTSVASPEKLDISPMPFSFQDNLQAAVGHPSLHTSFDLTSVEQLHSELPYEPPVLSPQPLSPHHSLIGSPLHQALSPQTVLTDIDEDPVTGDPSLRQISFSDLSLHEWNGSIVETGIQPEEVEKFISPQDPQTRQYYCLVEGCNKAGGFNRRENIRAHVQTHLGDRAFKCNVCEQRFVRQNDLKRHHGIHKSTKAFSCECGSRFARHDALTRHKQRGCCSVHSSPLKPERKKPGRPKKHRPELDDRVSKARKQRRLNADRDADESFASSGSEFSPSPQIQQTGFASLDATSFGDIILASSPPTEREDSPCPADGRSPIDTVEIPEGMDTIDLLSLGASTTFDIANFDATFSSLTAPSTCAPSLSFPTTSISQETFAAICSGGASSISSSSSCSASGLGIITHHHATPPPDTPPPSAASVDPRAQLAKKPSAVSPAHSLSTSLSTPPSSPPELGHDHHRGVEDDILDFIQPDLHRMQMQAAQAQLQPAKDCAWDALDLDLFGKEIAAAGGPEADAYFDSAFF